MVMLATISFFLGAVLALKCRVFILLPAICFGMICAAAIGIAQGDTVWSIVMTMALTATALQLGYLGGAAARVSLSEMRLRPDLVGTEPPAL
jgi:hypothetical protein